MTHTFLNLNAITTAEADAIVGKATYRAVLVIDGKEYPLFPHSKKTSRFASITKAAQALEAKTRNNSFDSRGLIINSDGAVVWTMAL